MSHSREDGMSRIRSAEQYRRDVRAKMAALKAELRAGLSKQYTLTERGTTLHFTTAQLLRHYGKWLQYYDREIIRLRAMQHGEPRTAQHAVQAQPAVSAQGKHSRFTTLEKLPVAVVIIMSLLLALGLAAVLKPDITGFAAKAPEPIGINTDAVDITTASTTSAIWQVGGFREGMLLTSVKVSGMAKGEGTAIVYLGDHVLLNLSVAPEAKSSAEATPAPSEAILETAPEAAPEAVPAVPETTEPVPAAATTETTAEVPATEPTTEGGLAAISGAAVRAVGGDTAYFTEECVDTCTLREPLQPSYTLQIRIEGVVELSIDELQYTLENASAQNATNATAEPQGILGRLIDKLLSWSFSITKRADRVEGDKVRFDGASYELVDGSEAVVFPDKSGEITIVAEIDTDSRGMMVSKHDYLNGKSWEIGVTEEGAILLSLSDSEESIELETPEAYNDGGEHTITIVLSGDTATIKVDDVEQVTEDISAIGDIDSDQPVSIGANAGYLEWMEQPIEGFNGAIKSIEVKYREASG